MLRARFLAFSALLLAMLALLSVVGCKDTTLRDDVTQVRGADGKMHEKIVVRQALSDDPKTLDPHKAGDVVSSQQCGMVYEQLFEYDYFERPARVIPCLAAEMPTISEDQRTYTIKVRDDVYFQDNQCFPDGKGRKFVASDVEYSLKRFASLSDTPGWWIADGKIEGLDAFRAFAMSATAGISDDAQKAKVMKQALEKKVSGISSNDATGVVRITLTEPYLQYVAANCMSYFAIVPHEAIEFYGETINMNPVGTGPFVMRYWNYKSEIVWDRNPTYREEYFPAVPADHKAIDGASEASAYKDLVGRRLPIADEFSFRMIKETQASWLEFLQGNLDTSGMDADQFTVAVQNEDLTPEMKARGIQLSKYDRPIVEYLVFNMDDPTWGIKGGAKAAAVRKAVALSYDREHHIQEVLNGRGSIANMLISPQFVGYDKDYTYPYSQFDPAKGREILREAGFKLTGSDKEGWVATDAEGVQPKITFLMRGTSGTSAKIARQLVYSGKRVGINIQTEMLQFPEFLKRQNEAAGQAYSAGWVFDYPDAQNILVLLNGKNAVPNGVNAARYRNADFDKLYDKMAALDQNDPKQAAEKKAIILEMHKILAKDCPWALIYFGKTYALSHDWYYATMPNDFAYNLAKYHGSISSERVAKSEEWRNVSIWPALIFAVLALFFGGLFVTKVLLQH